jgi:hypothetical protein
MPLEIVSDKYNQYRQVRELRLLDQNNGWPFACDIAIYETGNFDLTIYCLGHETTRISTTNTKLVLEVDKFLKELPEIPVS